MQYSSKPIIHCVYLHGCIDQHGSAFESFEYLEYGVGEEGELLFVSILLLLVVELYVVEHVGVVAMREDLSVHQEHVEVVYHQDAAAVLFGLVLGEGLGVGKELLGLGLDEVDQLDHCLLQLEQHCGDVARLLLVEQSVELVRNLELLCPLGKLVGLLGSELGLLRACLI